MATEVVSQLLYLLDEAFEGTEWHSLLGNLQAVTPADWTWVPPGGQRSVQEMVQHVGSCKLMYYEYAFGDARLTWDDAVVAGGDALSTAPSAIEWLRRLHSRLRESVAALDDAELLRPRMTN